jgi:hypothetical protein
MLPYPTILAITIVGVVMSCIFVFIGTGSIISVLVVMGLAALLFYLLQKFGVFKSLGRMVEKPGMALGWVHVIPIERFFNI